MFDSVTAGRYYPVDSKIHKLNPIAKIISTILFLLTISLIYKPVLLGILSIFVVILIYLSKIPIILFFNTLKNLKTLIIFMVLFNLIFSFSIYTIFSVIITIILLVFYTAILTYTTKPSDITYGLEKVMAPLKYLGVPVNSIALSISLAIRFIPIIIEEINKILNAMALRGIDYKHTNIKRKIEALGLSLIPMFILSFKRAEELANAMDVRLYGCNKNKTNYRKNRWSEHDNTMVIVHVGIFIIFILSEVAYL